MLGWFKTLFSLMPDLSGFKEMGFNVKVFNSDLYVECDRPLYSVRFYQGFEPFHPKLKGIVDFDIPDGLFLIVFKDPTRIPDLAKDGSELYNVFQFTVQRENFWFLYDKRLDFGTEQINVKAQKVLDCLEGLSL